MVKLFSIDWVIGVSVFGGYGYCGFWKSELLIDDEMINVDIGVGSNDVLL